MNPLTLFIPITKIDVAQRLVYGLATAECEDRSGEICDYESTKPYYEKWSRDVEKASDGKSLGNVRAMHSNVAAGKITALSFDDAAKQIEICAKIVDEAEWTKVCEGVYTGFSQGGVYVKRWRDNAGLMRYTADPSEVSLVDLPCLPSATFLMVKTDGAVEERQFGERCDVQKVGARNSQADRRRLQEAHDALVDLGAQCGEPKKAHGAHEGATYRSEFAKFAADTDALRKALASIVPVLDEILQRVKRIESQPAPLPFSGRPRPVSKTQELMALSDANPSEIGKFIEANRDALALEAIKLAQRRPQQMAPRR